MGVTVEDFQVAGDGGAVKRQMTVDLSRLAFEALTAEAAGSSNHGSLMLESALRCYLGDKEAKRPAWPYPDFLRGSETRHDAQIELLVEEGLWRDFEHEARAQGVSVEQLLEHAVFYFSAELNAGRLTQRILEDLE